MTLQNKQEKFYAVLFTIFSNNLSSHKLGGFQQCFNSWRLCRFCMINYPDVTSKLKEDNNISRSTEVLKYHLEAVQHC